MTIVKCVLVTSLKHPTSNFLKIFRSSDDKKQMKEEGDPDVEVEVEVDEKM